MHPLDFQPPDYQALVRERIREVFEYGGSFVESVILSRDGTVTPYFLTGRRVMFEGAPCLVGVGIDVSELRRTEQLLRISESGLAKAQRIAHLGSWELDIETGHLFWSDEIFRIFGTQPGAFTATYDRFFAFVHEEDRHLMQHAQDAALRHGVALNVEHRIVRPDGTVRWVHELGELERDSGGRATRLVGTVLDISVRKRAQEQLEVVLEHLESKVVARTAELQSALIKAEAADRVKSSFLATMSHELRTPLNSIIGFTGILLQGLAGPLNEEQAKQLGMVRGSARHLLELVNDVLDLSKIEAGQLQLHIESFDLPEVIERVAASLRPLAEKKGLELATLVDAAVGSMVGDRRRVEQVLINLLSNAIKFTERGGIAVSCGIAPVSAVSDRSQVQPRVLLRVADTGIGIGAEHAGTLFRPFQQLDTGLTRAHEGTGLGLAISSRLIGLMHGEITFKSRFGHGSEFSVTLPLQLERIP